MSVACVVYAAACVFAWSAVGVGTRVSLFVFTAAAAAGGVVVVFVVSAAFCVGA